MSRVLCSDKGFGEGPLLISPSHCVCPHGPFTPGGSLLLLGKTENVIAHGPTPQIFHPEALPLGVLPLPGSRTCSACFYPQSGEGPFSLVFLPFFQATNLSSNSVLPLGLWLLESKSQNRLLLILPLTSLKQGSWSLLPAQMGNEKEELQTTLTQDRNVCYRSATDNAEKKVILWG